jgi:heavy metal sensor kinase
MKRFNTLRVRFALWVAGLLLVALIAFGVFVYTSLARGLAASIDDSLQLSAVQTMAAVNIEDGQISISDSMPETSAIAGLREHGLTIRVLSTTGQIIQAVGPYRALPVVATSIDNALQRQPSFATVIEPAKPESIRFYTAPIDENGQIIGIVQVAQTATDMQETLNRLLAALLVSIPLLVCVAAVGGYALAARALAPIDQIARTARRISAEDLHARLNLPPTNDEVGRLARTFDEMLGRLDESFQRERQFTADASHELRTPLTAMQTILAVIREQRRTPEDYEQALDDLAGETARLRGMVEDLLQLARGESQPHMVHEPIDLSTLLRDVTDSLGPLAEAKGLALACDIPDSLTLCGDRDDLIRLFVNLLDNAIAYTQRGGVTVRATSLADTVRIAIADTGIGIAAAHLPRLFDRFYRIDPARAGRGAGLGLAIAVEIARAHNGTIGVQSTVGCGTTFTVGLPRASEAA